MRDQTATETIATLLSHDGDFPMRLSLFVERISTLRTSHNSVRGSRKNARNAHHTIIREMAKLNQP